MYTEYLWHTTNNQDKTKTKTRLSIARTHVRTWLCTEKSGNYHAWLRQSLTSPNEPKLRHSYAN